MYAPNFTASGMSLDDFWKIIDAIDNGDIPRNDNNDGANIIEYNRKTGEFRVVYTGETGIYYRMAEVHMICIDIAKERGIRRPSLLRWCRRPHGNRPDGTADGHALGKGSW